MSDRKHDTYAVVPDEARVVGAITAVHYLNPDGSYGYAVRAEGEETPGTTYLGLLVRAQQEVLRWADEAVAADSDKGASSDAD